MLRLSVLLLSLLALSACLRDTAGDGTVPCTLDNQLEAIADVWEVEVETGTLRVRVDTVSEATSFDPLAYVTAEGQPYPYLDAQQTPLGDDNEGCSYPPPGGVSCPDFLAPTLDGRLHIVVLAYLDHCNRSGEGAYLLEAEAGGTPLAVAQIEDDFEVNLSLIIPTN